MIMPFLDSPFPLAFAHRGFAPEGGENSMLSFDRAVQLGYRYLETDVRVTGDGVALAFHDASLDRVTDSEGRISQLSWEDVRKARIGGTEAIPLLADVLTTWPDVRLNIDVKSDLGVGATVDVIRRTAAIDRVCIGAFSDRRVAAVRVLLGPRLCTSLGPRAALALRLRSRTRQGAVMCRARPLGDCVQVPAWIGRLQVVDERLVRAAHGFGLPVHVWTVNDPIEMTRLLDLGVDGLISDRADVLREVLRARNAWPTGPERR
jgi:glycerophosphoryl diester phosphodiesterase